MKGLAALTACRQPPSPRVRIWNKESADLSSSKSTNPPGGPALMPTQKPGYLLKPPSANTITWTVRASTCGLEGTQTLSPWQPESPLPLFSGHSPPPTPVPLQEGLGPTFPAISLLPSLIPSSAAGTPFLCLISQQGLRKGSWPKPLGHSSPESSAAMHPGPGGSGGCGSEGSSPGARLRDSPYWIAFQALPPDISDKSLFSSQPLLKNGRIWEHEPESLQLCGQLCHPSWILHNYTWCQSCI